MGELKKFINAINNSCGKFEPIFNSGHDNFFTDILMKQQTDIFESDSPDIIIKYDCSVVGLEHFAIDSHFANKKGSKGKIQEKNAKLNTDRVIEFGAKENFDFLNHSEKVYATRSVKNLVNNFIANFKKHGRKINEYLENIEEIDKNKHICFFITNESLGMDVVQVCGKWVNFDIFRCREIIDFLISQDYVAHVLYKHSGNSILQYCDVTSKHLKSVYESINFYDENIELVDIKPNRITMGIYIKNSTK